MSAWIGRAWLKPAAKKPPPSHGIKITKVGTTWWGQRWIAALEEVLRGDAGRLGRGRTYARAGRTHDLIVKNGKVTAKVTGSRATPYKIVIELAQLSAAAWTQAIAGMAGKAQFSAELLAGEMPKEIDGAFMAAGASLFPKQRADLVTSCSCPDWGDPCKHVAATHYVLGDALDRDPFLLFELRGRTRDQVLDALRRARGGTGATADAQTEKEPKAAGSRKKPAARATKQPGRAAAGIGGRATMATTTEPFAADVPTVTLGKLTDAEYDRPRGSLPPMRFTFDQTVVHGAVLTQLGAPTSWSGAASPAVSLAPLVRAAADMARRLAMAEPPSAADERGAELPDGVKRDRAVSKTAVKRAKR